MRWIWIDKFLEFRKRPVRTGDQEPDFWPRNICTTIFPVIGHARILIIEGLAQTGGILVGEAGGFAEKVVLAKIPRADFLGWLAPVTNSSTRSL